MGEVRRPKSEVRARRSGGFTLLEMMVVVVLIGAVAAVVAVRLASQSDDAKVRITRMAISEASGAVELFKLQQDRWPDRLEELRSRPPDLDARRWPRGGYVKTIPADSWGRMLRYRAPGADDEPYDLGSYGEDGREGGEGAAADLWNHDAVRR